MPKTTTSRLLEIEYYIGAAQAHGEDSAPDHEVGDLQDFLRTAWSLMTSEQRHAFAKSSEVHSTLDATLIEYEAELAKLD